VDINISTSNTSLRNYLLTQLNNGSYLNSAWNATNTSYMEGANFTLQNISMQNYISFVNNSIVIITVTVVIILQII
jgi:hypothetical protein